MRPARLVLAIALVALAVACESEPPPIILDGSITGAPLGTPCTDGAQCESGLCVGDRDGQGVCTRTCESTDDCPAGTNWVCVDPAVPLGTRVCGCTVDSDDEICEDGIDNDCNGRVDDCMRCGDRVVVGDDDDHCGECFRACDGDETCRAGECTCTETSEVLCAGRCVDLQTSPAHCGACDEACGAGQICVGGACRCPADAPDVCDGRCVSLDDDDASCGACGNACAAGTTCRDGVCACPIAGDLQCDGRCVSTATDARHCGGCGDACEPGEQCRDGRCGCPIAGQVSCGGACRDLRSDVAHCGACGNACRAGEQCVSGACTCASGLLCGGVCVAADDRTNCGACGNVCRADQRCNAGSCVCSTGVECGGTCLDTSWDERNCGGCGNACGSAMTCSSGECRCTTNGQTFCASAGGCVDRSSDEQNCGECGRACPAAQICSSGTCRCASSQETYCPALGACVALWNDRNNCGTCGNACPAAQQCSQGTCSCAYGETYCAAIEACVDTRYDEQHCGACGNVCPAGTTCNGGTCRCDGAGLTLCGRQCVDLQTDESSCGYCGRGCAADRECVRGACWCPAPASGTPLRITTTLPDSRSASIASDGSRVGVAWVEGDANGGLLRFTILDASGARAGTDIVVNASATTAKDPSLLWNGSEWGVAWVQTTPESYLGRVYFARIDRDGTVLGAPVDLTAAWSSDSYALRVELGWAGAPGWGTAIWHGEGLAFQSVGVDGSALPLPVELDPRTSGPTLAIAGGPDGRFGILYENGQSFRTIAPDGSLAGAPIALGAELYGPAALAHDGTTWVALGRRSVYVSSSYRTQTVVLRGETLASPTVLAESMTSPTPPAIDFALAMRSGTYAAAWSTHSVFNATNRSLMIATARAPASGTGAAATISPPSPLYANETVSASSTSRLAFTGSDTLLAIWSDTRWGQTELYAMPFTLGPCR